MKIKQMAKNFHNLEDMNRVLSAHDWSSIDEWVDSFNALADLSDDEIIELEKLTRPASSLIVDRYRDQFSPE